MENNFKATALLLLGFINIRIDLNLEVVSEKWYKVNLVSELHLNKDNTSFKISSLQKELLLLLLQDVKILDSTPMATSMTSHFFLGKKRLRVRKNMDENLRDHEMDLFSLTVPKFLLKH